MGVLVTRPVHQAESLVTLIEAAGGRAVHFPTLKITPLACDREKLVDQLHNSDIVIFISANAVYCAHDLLGDEFNWQTQQLAVVGQRTALAMHELGWPVSIEPETRFDSEGLLDCNALQNVAGKRITIIRGVGGRETLATTLHERGANVDYAEVYQRDIPNIDVTPVIKQLQTGDINVISITSNNALQNLMKMLAAADKDMLFSIPMAVFSERQRQLAREKGFTSQITVAETATNDAMVKALEQACSALH
jgi:uroporphyrinogen-III synthase